VLERLEAASAWSPLAASAVIAARAREALAHGHPATEVVDLGLRALADGTLAEHDAAAATALTVAMTLGYAGRPDLGLHHLAHITSRLRARSASLLLKPARTFRGALASMEGRLVDALADFQAEFGGEAVWQTRSDPLMTGFYIEALLDRGDVAAAGRLLDRVDLDTATLDLLAHAPFLYARARVRLERGDPYGALEDMLLCGRRLQAGGWITNAVVPWQGAAARLLHEQGDASGATQQAECALATAEAAQIAAPLARALRDRAALTSELADRLALLERSAEVARGAPSPLARAAALVDLGFAVLAAGQPARARTTAREALDIARDAGAEPLSRRATRLLLDSGGRPRRATGARELTPAERRVARLAAAGATNREIADELVLSAKTIETHLRATYRKLAIRSRAQLPEALRARDDG
jgi:ATP/maltotriose-dependent transcriptional regulator MalT